MSRRTRDPSPPRTATPRRGRRRLIVLTCVCAGIGALLYGAIQLGPRFVRAARGPERSNVLLITIDTLRWDHLGCYGAHDSATPVLDGLAARGARFETAVMHVPLTAPSHASILTGLTPLGHGVRDNGAFTLSPNLGSLPMVFKQAGYDTAAFVSGFPLDRRFGFANGFDIYDDRLPRGAGRSTAQTERRADATTTLVLDWLGQRTTSAPWFLWVHYFDPHAPYEPPAQLRARFASTPYDGEIAFVDREIGRLFDRLQERVALAHTIVLVTADHGESLGDHGEGTHGVFVYDATVRVPWILAGPGIPNGIVPKTVARGVDVLPTLIDLAGIAVPSALDGRSLKPALGDRVMSDEPAYLESLLSQRHLGWAPIQGLRDARWKFIQVPRPELYDLQEDSAEAHNRAAADVDRATAMARHLQAQLGISRAPAAARAQDRETGERLRALGYLGGATAAAQTSSTRDPKDGIALINRLEHAIATIQVDPRRAAAELRAVLIEDPGSELARRQLAAALSATGNHAGAAHEIRTLQVHGAATAEDMLLLAESLRVQGRRDEAKRVVDEASRIDPRSPEVVLTRARMLMAEGRAEEAASAYRQALELAPDHPEALVGLGNLALASGDVRTASADFERVLARDPEDLTARTGLGLVRGREGRMPEAIALLEPVVRESPDNAEALAGLGAALARTGRPAMAVPYFQRAVAAGLQTPAVLNGLGFAKLEAGDRAGALAALRSSLAIRSDQPRVQQAVKDLSAQQGRSRDEP
jgi:choline-sulfatase